MVSNLFSIIDQAAAQLEAIPMTELLAIKGGDKPRLDKLRRLAKSLQQVQEFAGIKLV